MISKFSVAAGAAFVTGGLAGLVPMGATAAPMQPAGETVALAPFFASGPGAGAVGTYEQPGAPALQLDMRLPAGGTYSDLHFRTSNPGSAHGCTMAALAEHRETSCFVSLPALANNEVRTYTVTLTGKRDGVAFSRTATTRLRGAAATPRVWVNGQETTGQDAKLRAFQPNTVRYEVTNRSTVPLRNLTFFSGDVFLAGKCRIAVVEPGRSAACTFTLTLGEEALGGLARGRQATWPAMTGQGETGWNAWLRMPAGTFTFVK